MARAIDGRRRKDRRKKLLKLTKGFRGKPGKLTRQAKDAAAKAGQNAYNDRRRRKRDFRSLWIVRISAGCRQNGMRYSQFIAAMKKSGINLNRKALSNMLIEDPKTFSRIVESVKN